MAKSDARFGYEANLQRNDHDLGQRLGFTIPSGMLAPVWYDFASPGDSYYMQHDLPLLRSSVLAAPAMVDVKVHFETFFVPMQMIYQPFENTMFSLRNLQSSLYNMNILQDNNFPLFNYSNYISNLLSNQMSGDAHTDAFRMADFFGLNAMNLCKSVSSPSTDPRSLNSLMQYKPSFFPYQILAYHTIFEYYFRLDDKTAFHAYDCNWDQYYGTTSAITPSAYTFMELHQRPWDFDYFTSMYRSPIVSNANLQSILPANTRGELVPTHGKFIKSDGDDANGVNADYRAFSSSFPTTYGYTTSQKANSTATIRQMFASEKLAMITGRTKKNYDSQVLAHYGVNVPHDVKHDITMIHHDEYDLHVQEVTALAESTNQPLGELAGKSYAVGNGKQFKFTAPCHGVVMTIFSVEPKKRYFGGFDKQNVVTTAFDLPTPEFDRLGNMPMFRYETGMMPQTGGTYAMTDLIGWKERYYQFKRKYDKTTLAFGHDITGTSINNYSPYMLSFRPFGLYNSGSSSTSQAPRPDLDGRFYIERSAVDALCMVNFQYGWLEGESGGVPSGENWSVTPWLVYARDPFIVNSNIQCKKVSWMSKDGEPIYNY